MALRVGSSLGGALDQRWFVGLTSDKPPAQMLTMTARHYWMAPVAVALIAMASARAGASPLIFDFEDGTTQGWSLNRRTTLVSDSAVNGTYAVFGTDGANMAIVLDLTNIGYISIYRSYAGDVSEFSHLFTIGEDALRRSLANRFVEVSLNRDDETIRLGIGRAAAEDPDIRTYDVPMLTGTWVVVVSWNDFYCQLDYGICAAETYPGYVDDITFHGIPEPRALGLSATALLCALARRRWAARLE